MQSEKVLNCPACKSDSQEFMFRDRNRREGLEYFGTYVRCSGFSLVYLTERPRWEELRSLYSVISKNEDSGEKEIVLDGKVFNAKFKNIIKRMRFRPHNWPVEIIHNRSKRLLDIGCGSGAKLVEFANRGFDVFGIDVDGDSIRQCRKLLPQGQFVKGELHEAGFPDNYFDYIRIDNALEHMPNPRAVVSQCYRLLKQGGRVLIYTPNGRSLSMRFMKGNSITSWIPFHLQLFTHVSLRYVMEEAKLRDIRIYEHYPYSWLPLSFVQWKRRNSNQGFKFIYPRYINLVFYPVGLLCSKIGLGEELVGVGIK